MFRRNCNKDCLSHELLIDKLDAYGPDKKSIILIYNYLSNCKTG